jgi:hypothetical protein
MIGWQDERAGYKSPPAIIMTQGSTTVGKVPRPGDVGNPNRDFDFVPTLTFA